MNWLLDKIGNLEFLVTTVDFVKEHWLKCGIAVVVGLILSGILRSIF